VTRAAGVGRHRRGARLLRRGHRGLNRQPRWLLRWGGVAVHRDSNRTALVLQLLTSLVYANSVLAVGNRSRLLPTGSSSSSSAPESNLAVSSGARATYTPRRAVRRNQDVHPVQLTGLRRFHSQCRVPSQRKDRRKRRGGGVVVHEGQWTRVHSHTPDRPAALTSLSPTAALAAWRRA